MSLRLDDHWLWDFWFARDGDDVHLFFLQAPRSLGDPELRHVNATIGHAVSTDLREWRVLPDALGTGAPGEFDDRATWTGSVLRHGGRWHLFYTGISRAENGTVQRIGHATSDDLVDWQKQGVILEADPRWYEKRGAGAPAEHWRDPWAVWDEDSEAVHLLITARAPHGPADGRGVIGHAWSRDLASWEVGPPVSEPGEFAQLEVSQLFHLGGRWRLLFCATQNDHSALRLGRPGIAAEGGTHYLSADARFGPYALDTDAFLVGAAPCRHYAGRVIQHRGAWWFLAWRMYDERHGGFLGELSDPMPLRARPDGSLHVEVRPAAGPPGAAAPR